MDDAAGAGGLPMDGRPGGQPVVPDNAPLSSGAATPVGRGAAFRPGGAPLTCTRSERVIPASPMIRSIIVALIVLGVGLLGGCIPRKDAASRKAGEAGHVVLGIES